MQIFYAGQQILFLFLKQTLIIFKIVYYSGIFRQSFSSLLRIVS